MRDTKGMRNRVRTCGYGHVTDQRLATHAHVVQDYLALYSNDSEWVLAHYRDLPSLESAVDAASLALLPNGKRHPHQYRIAKEALKAAGHQLRRAVPRLRGTRSFQDLHALIDGLLSGIRGVGELFTYDTACRIGAFLRLDPQSVYLHSGTREGARALGLGAGRATVNVSELPAEFGVLKPHQVEDCLCIYKSELARIAEEWR